MSHYDDQYAETAEQRQRELQTVRAVAMLRLNEAVALLNGPGIERSREHSIAVTHIETAVRWLK